MDAWWRQWRHYVSDDIVGVKIVKILSVNNATKSRRDGTYFKSFTGISDDDKIIHFTQNQGESTIHGEVQENNYNMFLNIQLTSSATKTFANIKNIMCCYNRLQSVYGL